MKRFPWVYGHIFCAISDDLKTHAEWNPISSTNTTPCIDRGLYSVFEGRGWYLGVNMVRLGSSFKPCTEGVSFLNNGTNQYTVCRFTNRVKQQFPSRYGTELHGIQSLANTLSGKILENSEKLADVFQTKKSVYKV